MKLISYSFGEDIDKMYILPISDTHFGDPLCNVSKLQSYLKWAANNNTKIILNGDMFNLSDLRKYGDCDMLPPNEQLDLAVKIFYPIRKNILGVTEGNHDQRLIKDANFDMIWEFCQRLDITDRYNRDSVIIRIDFGSDKEHRASRKIKYLLYATHGWGGGKSKGSKVNNMDMLSKTFPCFDVYIASHNHFAVAYQDIAYIPTANKTSLTQMKRSYVSSGCFVNYGGYAERKGYPAVKLGSVRIRLDGRKRDVHVSL